MQSTKHAAGVCRSYVAVVGAGVCDESIARIAEEVGRGLASRGAVLVCGGLSGVMEAACRGAKSAGGVTVGILPGTDREEANAFVDVAIATGLGEVRNTLVVRAADAVIAIGGEWGTLSEIAFALKTGKRVIGLRSWTLAKEGVEVSGIVHAACAAEAVEKALEVVTG